MAATPSVSRRAESRSDDRSDDPRQRERNPEEQRVAPSGKRHEPCQPGEAADEDSGRDTGAAAAEEGGEPAPEEHPERRACDEAERIAESRRRRSDIRAGVRSRHLEKRLRQAGAQRRRPERADDEREKIEARIPKRGLHAAILRRILGRMGRGRGTVLAWIWIVAGLAVVIAAEIHNRWRNGSPPLWWWILAAVVVVPGFVFVPLGRRDPGHEGRLLGWWRGLPMALRPLGILSTVMWVILAGVVLPGFGIYYLVDGNVGGKLIGAALLALSLMSLVLTFRRRT